MIGMPRIRLMIAALAHDKGAMPETRINAQIRPSSVERSSEPSVTMIVNATPCIRIGTNSAASPTNLSIHAALSDQTLLLSTLCLQAPFGEDFVDRAVGFQLGKRGVDLGEQLRVPLAHADADRTDHGRLVAFDNARIGKAALL